MTAARARASSSRRRAASPTPSTCSTRSGPDGFAWFADGEEFVTAGTAATVDPADAVAFLRSVERAGDAGGLGVRAVGALPFAGRGRLVVPARIVERDAVGQRVVDDRHAGDAAAPDAPPARSHRPAVHGRGPPGPRRVGRDGHRRARARREQRAGKGRARARSRHRGRRAVRTRDDHRTAPRDTARMHGLRRGGIRRRDTRAARAAHRKRRRVTAHGRHRAARGIARRGSPLDRTARVVGEGEPRAPTRRRRGRG